MAIGAGTDIAIKSAEVVLINSAIALSKATIQNIKQNPAPAILCLKTSGLVKIRLVLCQKNYS